MPEWIETMDIQLTYSTDGRAYHRAGKCENRHARRGAGPTPASFVAAFACASLRFLRADATPCSPQPRADPAVRPARKVIEASNQSPYR